MINLLGDVQSAQPVVAQAGPLTRAGDVGTEADSMSPLGEHMEFDRYTCFGQSRNKSQAILYGNDRIFSRAPNETGRCFRSDLPFVRQTFNELGIGVLAEQILHATTMGEDFAQGDHRIAYDTKVGATALLVDRILGACIAQIEVSQNGRYQVPTGGEADYADSVGIDIPLGGILACEANRRWASSIGAG